MTNETDPALLPVPDDTPGDRSLPELRRRLLAALQAEPEPPPNLWTVSNAPSPVDFVVAAFRAMRDAEASLSPVLRARFIDCAHIIAANGYHGLRDEAAAEHAAQLLKLADQTGAPS